MKTIYRLDDTLNRYEFQQLMQATFATFEHLQQSTFAVHFKDTIVMGTDTYRASFRDTTSGLRITWEELSTDAGVDDLIDPWVDADYFAEASTGCQLDSPTDIPTDAIADNQETTYFQWLMDEVLADFKPDAKYYDRVLLELLEEVLKATKQTSFVELSTGSVIFADELAECWQILPEGYQQVAQSILDKAAEDEARHGEEFATGHFKLLIKEYKKALAKSKTKGG